MRTAEDLIARAEADNRGVALIPLSEPTRDISFETPAAARVRIKQIKPKPHAVERADALPALGRFLGATPDVELVWLTDGVDLGGGSDFVAALGRLVEQRPMTVIEGGIARRTRARRRRQCRRRAHRESLACRPRAPPRPAPCARSTSRACRSATPPSRSRTASARPTPSSTLPVEIRNDIARLEIAAERSAGAVALLDKRWRRRSIGVDHRIERRHRAAAAGLDLLSHARARTVRRCAARRPRLAGASGEPVHRAAPADADPGRCRQCRRGARSAHPLDRRGRRAGALCRTAARSRRRRSRAGEAPARRPRSRRQPLLGAAAAAQRFLARKSFLRNDGADRRDREPSGAGRTRRHSDRAHLGDTRRRHATRDGAAPRQGLGGPVPRHRRYALVRPAAIGHIRRNAQANRVPGRFGDSGRWQRRERARRARGVAPDPRSRRLRHIRPAASDGATGAGELRRPRNLRPSARVLRATRGIAGGERACARRSACAARRIRAQCAPGGLPNERTARSARTDSAGRACAARA